MPGLGNLISGNVGSGVVMTGFQNTDSILHGNLIGTDASGLQPLANGTHGVEVIDEVELAIIGGAGPGQGNLISGNAMDGIHLEDIIVADIFGNIIGADIDGQQPMPNGGSGIAMIGSRLVNAGGSRPEEGNLISGNARNGIFLEGALRTDIRGNIIGGDKDGRLPIPNGGSGIAILDSSNTEIGDANANIAAGCRSGCNVISGNAEFGILVSGPESHTTKVTGNHIGAALSGFEALPNSGAGVAITSGAHDIQIGTQIGQGNIIGGNLGPGILLSGEAVQEIEVYGNVIGLSTDAGGSIANQHGIVLVDGAHDNRIGSDQENQVNTISGNLGFGVLMQGSGTRNNTVASNFIGTNKTGHEYVGNGGAGVRIEDGAHDNTIGIDDVDHSGNLIASNIGEGVVISGGNANHVFGNRIGRSRQAAELGNRGPGVLISNSSSGNEVFGNQISFNQGNGVELRSGANGNTIGRRFAPAMAVFIPGRGNEITRNTGSGVLVEGGGTSANVIAGNLIGTNPDGDHDLGNGFVGVFLDGGEDGGANGNTLVGNRIVNTVTAAIAIKNSDGNTIFENGIGRTWAPNNQPINLGNFGQGIYLLQGSSENWLEGNVVTFNSGAGVILLGGEDDPNQTVHNTITQNSIAENAGPGIVLDAGNESIGFPVVTGLEQGAEDKWKITGKACGGCTVEVFSDWSDKGARYEDSLEADGDGEFTIEGLDDPVVARRNFRLTATDEDGNTSEFGPTEDLTITGIEVTQGIQDLDNSVKLFAGRTTYVRVYARSTFMPAPNVTARLSVGLNANSFPELTPTGWGCDTKLDVFPEEAADARPELDHSFCFKVPSEWVQEGVMNLTATVNPDRSVLETDPNNNSMKAGPFEPEETPVFQVAIRRIIYQEGMKRKWSAPNSDELERGVPGYTEDDALAAGDVDADGKDEILVGSAETGRVYVFGRRPSPVASERIVGLEESFPAQFTEGSRIAAGDVYGNGEVAVLIAHGEDDTIDVFTRAGRNWILQDRIDARFETGWEFAVGNYVPDGVSRIDEILMVDPGDGLMRVMRFGGQGFHTVVEQDIALAAGDAFAVGDVFLADGVEEVLVAHAATGLIDVFDWESGHTPNFSIQTGFSRNGRIAAADLDNDLIFGSGLAEILVAMEDCDCVEFPDFKDDCRCVDIYKWLPDPQGWSRISRFDGFAGKAHIFTAGDGFATADVTGSGFFEVLIGDKDIDEDSDNEYGTVDIFNKRGGKIPLAKHRGVHGTRRIRAFIHSPGLSLRRGGGRDNISRISGGLGVPQFR